MKRRLVLALAILVLRLPSVRADTPPEPVEFGITDARERFRRGVELYREGSTDAALAEFNKAYELAPNYRVLYNLAQVQTERHDYVAAIGLFNDYLEQGGNDIPVERRGEVERDLASLKARVAVLWVHTSVAGAELVVDNVSIGVLPLTKPVLMNAGVHQLQLRKAGYETSAHTLSIAGSETVRLELPMALTGAAASAKAGGMPAAAPLTASIAVLTERRPAPPNNHVPLWVSLISAGVFTGGAVTFGVLAREADSRLDRELARTPADRVRVEDARAEVSLNAALCDGFATTALVAAGLSLYFALSASSDEAGPGTDTAVRVVPSHRGLSFVQQF